MACAGEDVVSRKREVGRSAEPELREMAVRSEILSDNTKNFSLVLGGPLYQLFVRIGLVKPPLDRVLWRIVVIAAFAWLPLLLLTALGGRLMSGVRIPFLQDFEVHARLLLSLPLLIAAEVTIHQRMRELLLQFVERRVVTPAILPKFEAILESAVRLRNSIAAEVGLIVFIVLASGLWRRQFLQIQSDTWSATIPNGGEVYTPAGYWYYFVSLPVFQFIMLRWYFRLWVWGRLLRQISKLELNLVPTHPDGSCGLGFLDGIVLAMAPFLLGQSLLLSGYVANRIFYAGSKLPDHYLEIGVLAALLALIALGPLCVFTPPLLRARRKGLLNYGRLASDYVVGFDRKWIQGERPADEPLVGSGDIQSLADLANSYSVVRSITPFPFGRSSLIGLAVIIALPLLPLTLTMFSFEELALRLLKILL
jgi:hypothetical protein